jgi:uncharacterized protein with PQ loop repeat
VSRPAIPQRPRTPIEPLRRLSALTAPLPLAPPLPASAVWIKIMYFIAACHLQFAEVAGQLLRRNECPVPAPELLESVDRGCVMDLPIIAGTVSTVIFATSMLPMLIKARRTRDLASYSLGNIVLSNLGNLVHSVYVFSLPAGPVWALHGFYLVAAGLLLLWYFRFNLRGGNATTQPNQSTVVA